MLLDYGKCPDQPCQNGALCAKRGSPPRDFYCKCPNGFNGRYCESVMEDLFPLILLPIFLGVLLLLLICLCCCLCCRGVGGDQVSKFTSVMLHLAESQIAESRKIYLTLNANSNPDGLRYSAKWEDTVHVTFKSSANYFKLAAPTRDTRDARPYRFLANDLEIMNAAIGLPKSMILRLPFLFS